MSNQRFTNYDTSKMFVWDVRTESGNLNNSDYDPVTFPKGTLMGRVAATGLLVPLTSGASDGSQIPVGILFDDYVVDGGDTVEVAICVSGDVVEDGIIFQGSDDFDTVVSGRQLRDRIAGDTVGIHLIKSTELTDFDNQ